MVIGRGFAWGHIPKTGGDSTAAMFALFPELVVAADDRGSHAKHDAWDTRLGPGIWHLLLNIRPLPVWVISYYQMRARGGVYENGYKPLPLPSSEEMASSTIADRYMGEFTSDTPIDTWLRTDHLADDFLAWVGGATDVDAGREAAVRGTEWLNKATYNRDSGDWFTATQLEKLYVRNPCWAEIEEEVLGGRWANE